MNDTLVFAIERWSAWAPELSTLAEWQAWAEAPDVPAGDAAPNVPFIQASLRRRASKIAKMMLWTIYGALPTNELDAVASVFATEGGESETTLALLEQLARGELLSPLGFSLSVHNASAGLFAIAAKNKKPSTTVSAGGSTVACGLLEAITQLHYQEDSKLLLVSADERLPTLLRNNYVPTTYHYGMALTLSRAAADSQCTLTVAPREGREQGGPSLPQPFALIKFLLSEDRELLLQTATVDLRLQKSRAFTLSDCFRSPLEELP